MTQVDRAGPLSHAELDRWLAKDAANCCLLDFSDTDAFLQASIPSIWDPISSQGEDVMSYFSDANIFPDANAGGMSALVGNSDAVHHLYDYSCSDSEVDDSDTVSSDPDNFLDLAASFLVESDVPGAAAEEECKDENTQELPVERPRNRRKREVVAGGSNDDTPARVVRPFKRQRMVGPIINIHDDALHSTSQTPYLSSDSPVQVHPALSLDGVAYGSKQWKHDDDLVAPFSAIDDCNEEEVNSPRSDATNYKEDECEIRQLQHQQHRGVWQG